MPTTLITGCNSCTGTHLVALLRARGETGLAGADLGDSSALPLAYHACDMRDAEQVAALIGATRPAVIYHLAATTNERDPVNLLRTNVEGTLHLFNACRELARPPRIVVISSCSVCPDLRPDDPPLTEDVQPAPATVYAISRLAQAELALAAWRREGVPVLIARTFNLVGPGLLKHLAPAALLERIRAAHDTGIGQLAIANGDFVRDFVDVRDAAQAYALIAERGEPGMTYNVGAGRGTTIRQLAETIAATLGDSLTITDAPVDATPGRSVLRRSVADVSRLRALGWAPAIGLAESVADMAAMTGNSR